MADAVQVSFDEENGATILHAQGSWTATQIAIIAAEIGRQSPSAAGAHALVIDAAGMTALDTFGAWLLRDLQHEREALGQTVRLTNVPERFADLLSAIDRAGRGDAAVTPPRRTVLDHIANLGQSVTALGRDLHGLLEMLGQIGVAFIGVIRNPSTFRLTSTVHQIDRVAWQAVPIILLITFLIGCIIAQQGFFHFRKFGADQYVVDMTGILIVREIGVLLVAIMVAGRSGSSYTAELGSMKMREEIDAVKTMGLDPIAVLILPRIIALVIALPALTLLGSLSALYGGGLVAWAYGDMSPDIYIARLREAVSMDHFKVGILKAPFMALMIGLVACREGFDVKGSAESLGLKTTASVVKSIFLVIVLDGLFAIYFAAIGL